jgi:hypothetical protein
MRYRRNSDEERRRYERAGNLAMVGLSQLRVGERVGAAESEAMMVANNVRGFVLVPRGGTSVMPGQTPWPFAWADSPHALEALFVVYAGVDLDQSPHVVPDILRWGCLARPGDATEWGELYLIVAIRGDARGERGVPFTEIGTGPLGQPEYP